MFLIVGLGNPGKLYSNNRHNIGYKILDNIREMYSFHTIDSQIQASERAEYDAREVETELRLSRKQYRRMSC